MKGIDDTELAKDCTANNQESKRKNRPKHIGIE
jgi:hypothetical protein